MCLTFNDGSARFRRVWKSKWFLSYGENCAYLLWHFRAPTLGSFSWIFDLFMCYFIWWIRESNTHLVVMGAIIQTFLLRIPHQFYGSRHLFVYSGTSASCRGYQFCKFPFIEFISIKFVLFFFLYNNIDLRFAW